MQVKFVLTDNFIWDLYEEQVYRDIVNAEKPVEVLWNLGGITKIPSWSVILSQAKLMLKIKESIRKNILKNRIIVNSEESKVFLEWVFTNIYTPEKETVITV